jgi:hypothetical protein
MVMCNRSFLSHHSFLKLQSLHILASDNPVLLDPPGIARFWKVRTGRDPIAQARMPAQFTSLLCHRIEEARWRLAPVNTEGSKGSWRLEL